MNFLPFDFEKHRLNKIGTFEQALEKSAPEAEKIFRQMDSQRKHIDSKPSHYAYLRDNIYGAME